MTQAQIEEQVFRGAEGFGVLRAVTAEGLAEGGSAGAAVAGLLVDGIGVEEP